MRPYYEAYDERYRTVHAKGVSWSSSQCTPIVLETIQKYGKNTKTPMLELGCGEGRDAAVLLTQGYDLLATDLSPEAIAYCREVCPTYAQRFALLDCVHGSHPFRYGFLYAVAVIHMLVLDEDRDAFYRFVHDHLTEDGIALICTMGDGETEMKSDVSQAFSLRKRQHEAGEMLVAATSCRMVCFETFRQELERNDLEPIEAGLTESPPDFSQLMYAVVRVKKPESPYAT